MSIITFRRVHPNAKGNFRLCLYKFNTLRLTPNENSKMGGNASPENKETRHNDKTDRKEVATTNSFSVSIHGVEMIDAL